MQVDNIMTILDDSEYGDMQFFMRPYFELGKLGAIHIHSEIRGHPYSLASSFIR